MKQLYREYILVCLTLEIKHAFGDSSMRACFPTYFEHECFWPEADFCVVPCSVHVDWPGHGYLDRHPIHSVPGNTAERNLIAREQKHTKRMHWFSLVNTVKDEDAFNYLQSLALTVSAGHGLRAHLKVKGKHKVGHHLLWNLELKITNSDIGSHLYQTNNISILSFCIVTDLVVSVGYPFQYTQRNFQQRMCLKCPSDHYLQLISIGNSLDVRPNLFYVVLSTNNY